MIVLRRFTFLLIALTLMPAPLLAEVTRVELLERRNLTDAAVDFSYEMISGVVYFDLDPGHPANAAITDIGFAPTNADGKVEFSADFKLLLPSADIASDVLLYQVNNRGNSRPPPEASLQHPLSAHGHSYLVTGWINELAPRAGRLRLHAPVVSDAGSAITGEVRYEVIVGRPDNDVNIAGGGHLAYAPTAMGLRNARLTRRQYQNEPRVPVERGQFSLSVNPVPDSNQPEVLLNIDGGLQPGVIYELIYEAENPVLAGAGMAGIRDLVSLIRHDHEADELAALDLPEIEHTVAWGISQSGRLLRQFVYDGFNADLQGRQVFDGVIPIIAGAGFGMFNNRFAMPTRTNGHHSNHLFPNDLFPFAYGDSTDPWTGQVDAVLGKAEASGTVPKLMNIQTSNEYWVRAGSLVHTKPDGSADLEIPEAVRIYTIGGSQHSSRDGLPRGPRGSQLPENHNLWSPISESLIAAMVDWVAEGVEPPASRYPRLADGSLVPAHVDGRINTAAWNPLNDVQHPESIYQPAHVSYGGRWASQRIIDVHPTRSDHYYQALVPAVNRDNNDLGGSTILPPLTSVPLGTFTPWNLRAPETGAPRSMARLMGGYIPFLASADRGQRDPRSTLVALYRSYSDYLQQYAAATDQLIAEGYLLPEFRAVYMEVAEQNRALFP